MSVIYGINPIIEQLQADPARIEHLFLLRGQLRGQLGRVARLAREKGVVVSFLDRKALSRKAAGGAHQGAVAQAAGFEYASLDEILQAPGMPGRVVFLDGVQDPRNLGSIVRTAVCAGAGGIVIPARGVAAMTPAAVKTSAGAAARARVARVTNLARALGRARESGLWCVAVEAGGERDVRELDCGEGYALVFGGEEKGLRRLVRSGCDISTRIPMPGRFDSLNVAVAVGITLFSLGLR